MNLVSSLTRPATLDPIETAPVGLSTGAKGPAEIALSVLAEIVQVARANQ
jgi:xanthine/CO dehydrogenase XdhC/CoxF family maturation factor